MFFSTFQMIEGKVLLNYIACISFSHFQTLFINQFAPNQLKLKHFLQGKKKRNKPTATITIIKLFTTGRGLRGLYYFSGLGKTTDVI